jgi:hypothetical protein
VSSARRKLSPDAEQRIAAAGVRSWPVVIRVNRTRTATGITTTHHRIDGSDGAFMSVGAPLEYDDVMIETPDGAIREPGLARAILDTYAAVNLRKVA